MTLIEDCAEYLKFSKIRGRAHPNSDPFAMIVIRKGLDSGVFPELQLLFLIRIQMSPINAHFSLEIGLGGEIFFSYRREKTVFFCVTVFIFAMQHIPGFANRMDA